MSLYFAHTRLVIAAWVGGVHNADKALHVGRDRESPGRVDKLGQDLADLFAIICVIGKVVLAHAGVPPVVFKQTEETINKRRDLGEGKQHGVAVALFVLVADLDVLDQKDRCDARLVVGPDARVRVIVRNRVRLADPVLVRSRSWSLEHLTERV